MARPSRPTSGLFRFEFVNFATRLAVKETGNCLLPYFVWLGASHFDVGQCCKQHLVRHLPAGLLEVCDLHTQTYCGQGYSIQKGYAHSESTASRPSRNGLFKWPRSVGPVGRRHQFVGKVDPPPTFNPINSQTAREPADRPTKQDHPLSRQLSEE